ncbi:MAG TPA: hypothetical protein VFQ73_01175 [Flavisolibacter sp.]|nr:hypothetical protein [Flavisolibacter sp.]
MHNKLLKSAYLLTGLLLCCIILNAGKNNSVCKIMKLCGDSKKEVIITSQPVEDAYKIVPSVLFF